MATKKTKKKVQFWGTGRRKKAIARVRLIPEGSGVITINKRSIDEYFGLDTLKQIVRQPLELTENLAKYDVIVNVQGGGFTGQAGAIRHGISRASPEQRKERSTVSRKQDAHLSSARDNRIAEQIYKLQVPHKRYLFFLCVRAQMKYDIIIMIII